jgi:hypothetical protein
MTATSTPSTDPIDIVRQLDAETIRARIDTLDRERQALMVLLRAAQRMQLDTAPDSEDHHAER